MANARGKTVDNTHLSIDLAEERNLIHRDYIAHALRWSHVAKFVQQGLRYKTTRVLDIGCGVDLPLARMLYSNRFIVEDFVGVDYNDPDKFKMEFFKNSKMPVTMFGNVDAAKHLEVQGDSYSVAGSTPHRLPNLITMFEVFEHIEPAHGRRMLQKIYELLAPDPNAVAFISTPNWDPNVGQADNHVSETRHEALGALIEDLGFEIVEVYGTFASIKDYKPLLTPPQLELFEQLRAYYDSNLLAIIFAPLFPAQARNCIWQIRPVRTVYERRFPYNLSEVPGPWTASEKWEELDG